MTSASELLLEPQQDTCGALSMLSNHIEDKLNTNSYHYYYKPAKLNMNGVNMSFKKEISWQEWKHMKLESEIGYCEKLISSQRLPKKEKGFIENPLYFNDRSNGFENNGYGDHYLYSIYAGLPHVMMVDKQGYFTNQKDFFDKSVGRILSHKNSLLSSGSTTQIVGRVAKGELTAQVLSLLRPKDPLVKDHLIERHKMCLTNKRDRNKESFYPYLANINFPKQFAIDPKSVDPFPKGSLKEFGLKQHRKKLRIKPRKKVPFIPKVRFRDGNEKIFQWRRKEVKENKGADESKETEEEMFPEILRKVVATEKRLKIDMMKESKQRFLDSKRIPLVNYQCNTHQDKKFEGFFDIQPKIEIPWLTNMIKNGTFTRKYYLEKFMNINRIDSPGDL